MNMLKKFLSVIVCFFIGMGFVYAEGISDVNNQETEPDPLEAEPKAHISNVENSSVECERDPFNVSTELLKKTISEKYVYFTGQSSNKFRLPRIEISGVMVAGSKTMATANIETLGDVTLKPNDTIVFAPSVSGNKNFRSFTIKEITPNEMIILLEGGDVIHGRFR